MKLLAACTSFAPKYSSILRLQCCKCPIRSAIQTNWGMTSVSSLYLCSDDFILVYRDAFSKEIAICEHSNSNTIKRSLVKTEMAELLIELANVGKRSKEIYYLVSKNMTPITPGNAVRWIGQHKIDEGCRPSCELPKLEVDPFIRVK